eukprot:TRINITY_DN93242_c0_g1_i1.p1 TRINITY_DN93242_c0_g1~~TRINITY_DN93242_c0_g1_i1.p1  ORF type:complete len:158 (-),score=31.64 TRINITY_DN93242_c0_g1_i1:20-493(-)
MGAGDATIETGTDLRLQFAKRGGLLPVIVQCADTLQVLMLGYANEAAVEETLRSKLATFWSTSRNELWKKGLTSGDYLRIAEVLVDCDQDCLLYKVRLVGHGSCHTKGAAGDPRRACFYRRVALPKDISDSGEPGPADDRSSDELTQRNLEFVAGLE